MGESQVISLRAFLMEHGYSPEASVYNDPDFLDYSINRDFDLNISPVLRGRDSFRRFWDYRDRIREKQKDSSFQELQRMLKECKSPGEKKLLRTRKRSYEAQFEREAARELFGIDEPGFQPAVLRILSLTAFQISEIPYLYEKCPSMRSKPWFTGNLATLKEMLEQQDAIGIEGGSCLIGCNEMHFVLTTADGVSHRFDFTMMHSVTDFETLCRPDVSDEMFHFVQEQKGEIVEAYVDCRKNAITKDEVEEYRYLFEMASALDARLIVTIPDFSYEKTFLQIFSCLDPKVFAPFYENFLQCCDRIADINLRWIFRFQEWYQLPHFAVLHRRCKETMDCFREHRDRVFAQRNIGRPDTREYMEPAIRDYICMPAMPYYFWGVTDLIEVNNLREALSVSKCKRLHSGVVRLFNMLYPHPICANGKCPEFFAENHYKEYTTYEDDKTSDS